MKNSISLDSRFVDLENSEERATLTESIVIAFRVMPECLLITVRNLVRWSTPRLRLAVVLKKISYVHFFNKYKYLHVNPLNPIVHFWLHHTAHCAEKIVSARLRAGSASAERVGQGEVGGVTGGVLCTWWLLGLALKRPWLVPGGPPHALTAWTRLRKTLLSPCRGLDSCKKGCLVSERGVWQPIALTITCSLMSGCGQSHETAY